MLFDFLRKKKSPAPVSKDAAVIEQLKKHGSKTDRPHDVDFFFFMPDQITAENFSTVLSQDGYSCQCHANDSAGSPKWSVIAIKSVVPDVETMEHLTLHLQSLAERYNGVYDGWGTGVVTDEE